MKALAALLALCSLTAVPLAAAAGADRPALRVSTLDGATFDLAEQRGNWVIVNFWATWCSPCIKEMPDLDYLQQKYPGITIVGLAVDTAKNVIKFSEKVPVSYPVLVAGHGGIQLMKEMGNPRGGLPYTILFDAQGQAIKHFLGQIQRDELDAVLASVSSV